MIFRFRASLTGQLERIMRKALFAAIIGACFVMGGGIAGASFIRYVAAPSAVMADRTSADRRVEEAAEVAFEPVQKADDGACSAEVPVCVAAFAVFMLQAVLSANGAGGGHLAALREDAVKKVANADR
jgi:hypothetical protein